MPVAFWFTLLGAQMPNFKHHVLSLKPPSDCSIVVPSERETLRGRCMQIRALKVFPIEVIVRGYLTGSAWDEYQKSSTVHGIPQPAGLQRCQAFPGGPIYTPSTKAPQGFHDENISPEEARKIVGEKWAGEIENLALSIYKTAHSFAVSNFERHHFPAMSQGIDKKIHFPELELMLLSSPLLADLTVVVQMERGIIIADTKIEIALDEKNDEIVVVDELLTPDSSRFWPAPVRVGEEQPSFDKQHIRDYLKGRGLAGKPGVELPEHIVIETTNAYREVFRRLTSQTIEQAIVALGD
ncbi:MAG: Bifunctional purine biosynthetic protein ade1 [Alectoria sarmentosa]|nr:MAG: Bifunctional purine biosynthetic protein ade1 [Alectoria sarmentosa]